MGILDGNNKLANNGKTTHLEYDDDKVFIIVNDSDILAVINDVEED